MSIGATALERSRDRRSARTACGRSSGASRTARAASEGDGALEFDWTSGTVTGEMKASPSTCALEPDVQDRLSIQIAAVTALLRGQEPGDDRMIDDDKHQALQLHAEGAGTARYQDRKSRQRSMYESTRPNSNRMSRFWLVPEPRIRPRARIEKWRKGKVETVMTLTSLERRASDLTVSACGHDARANTTARRRRSNPLTSSPLPDLPRRRLGAI